MSSRYVQPLRILAQSGFLGFVIWLGVRYYRFVQMMSSGADGSVAIRPDGIDGFLPISGLLGTVSWLEGYKINSVHPAAVIVFVTVILVSFLLRRSFCSWICPIAAVSEWSWKWGFHLMRRNLRLPSWLDILLRSLKYLVMAFFIYSVAIAMSPEAQLRFIQSEYHMTADVRLMNFFLHISPSACGVIITLVGLSLLMRNPFCRYLCPYGALLGLVALFSPLRVTRDPDRCVSCGVCSQVCPAYIDVMHKSTVASPECIACWRCISHCRCNGALSMRAVRRFIVPGVLFAVLVVLLFWGGTVCGKLSGHWHSSLTVEEYVRLLGK